MGLHQINWNFENKKFISLIMLSGCFLLTGEKKKLKRKEKATRSSLRDLVLSFLHWSHFFNRNFYTPTTLQWAAAAAWYPLFMTLTPPVRNWNFQWAWSLMHFIRIYTRKNKWKLLLNWLFWRWFPESEGCKKPKWSWNADLPCKLYTCMLNLVQNYWTRIKNVQTEY